MCTDNIPNETIVLKFGGSVLTHPGEFATAVEEIRREVRNNRSVIAVVSAMYDATTKLVTEAGKVNKDPAGAAYAKLVAGGARHAAALLSLALSNAGQAHTLLSARDIRLVAQGGFEDAEPVSVDTTAVQRALNRAPVLVLPGLEAINEREQAVLLGGGGASKRGGTDLLAVFIAEALGADVRLVKDVDGLSVPGPSGGKGSTGVRRYVSISWEDAVALAPARIGPRALAFATRRGVRVRLAAPGSGGGTSICGWTEFEDSAPAVPVGVQPGVALRSPALAGVAA